MALQTTVVMGCRTGGKMEPWVPVFYESSGFGFDQWLALGTGFGGVLLGGVITLITNRAAHAHEKRARDRTQAATLVMRAVVIEGDIASTAKAINDNLERANDRNLTGRPMWSRLQSMAAIGEPSPLVIDDMSPLYALGQFALAARFIEIGMKQSALLELIRDYNRGREKLSAMIKVVDVTEDGIVTGGMTEAQAKSSAPHLIQLNTLAHEIVKRANSLASEAAAVANDLSTVFRHAYGNKFIPIVNRSD
jgi:hypothetical protein